MHIELISRSTVKITLTFSDLESFGLNYDMIQTESPETRELISDIINRLFLIKDIDLSREKLYIEVFSDKTGGCLMYISGARGKDLTESEVEPLPEERTEVIYLCRSIDELLDSAREIKALFGRNIASSSLYYSDEYFCLIISVSQDSCCKPIKRSPDGSAERTMIRAAHIREHCTPVLESNAIERLSELTLS
ncbi:MAG: adaptor protein MecA [Oscillospiraceae bacterium]|nr:adaptor protein MecA [Oscillospiraceae bacterium]